MTDKKIIINGVDVSGCEFYDKTANTYTCLLDTVSSDNNCYICKDNPNCYYKQLKRLEQENARLKNERTADLVRQINELKAYMDVNEDFKTAWAELKAENERLQKLTCFNCGEETLSPSGAEIYDKILVYKQTLQEIKAITEEHINTRMLLSDKKSFLEFNNIYKLITKAESEG